ncbi:MAG: MFS transporter [Geodermatophilaceae bacterium]
MPGVVDQQRLRGHPGFRRFWAATTISAFGTYITTLAIGVLVVVDLDGSAADVGWVNAARWAPYLVVGLLVGVLADRVRRKPLLVSTDLARAAVLGAVPLFAVTESLSVEVLVCLMAAFGLLSVCNDAAHQSFLPRLLPRAALPRANARLQQSDTVAQTSGPLLAGGLVAWLGAPVAVLADAVSYLVSGVLIAVTAIDDPAPERSTRGITSVLNELREGLRWVYRHPRLRPLALGTHAWFLFNAVLITVYVPFALRELDMGAGGLGVTLALAGLGGFLGTSSWGWLGRRLSPARILAGGRLVEAAGFAVVTVTPGMGSLGPAGVVAVAGAGQFLFGLGLGAEGPIELSYRQAVTPDRLLGRMNATMRSLNRAAIVVGAPLGGLLADAVTPRFALWVGVLGVAASAIGLAASGFRHATHDD